jgi:hypothetical protein
VNGWDIASSIASIVTALAVAFAVGQLVVARQQSHREFENIYVQRFWAIIDQFTDEVALQPAPQSFAGHDRVIALSYIRLCEDELDMRHLGRITNSTWSFWSPAIAATMSQTGYQELLVTEPELFARVREFLATKGRDPYVRRRFWSWLGGL